MRVLKKVLKSRGFSLIATNDKSDLDRLENGVIPVNFGSLRCILLTSSPDHHNRYGTGNFKSSQLHKMGIKIIIVG